MCKVALTISRDLRQVNGSSSDYAKIYMPIVGGETVLDLLRSYGSENEIFRKAVFEEQSDIIEMHVLVTMNGRLINPYNESSAGLKDGDQVTVFTMMAGG